VFRPPAGTRSFVTGIHFRNAWPPTYWLMDTSVESGTVCFEECTFWGRDWWFPGLYVVDAEVVLRRCGVFGGSGSATLTTGLWCTNSSVFAIDCLVRAGSLSIDSRNHSGDGITADNTQLHLVRVDVVGGDSNSAASVSGYAAGHGVRLRGTSRAWIADCTLRGGNGIWTAGGTGLRNVTSVPVQLARTTLTGGAGSPAGLPSFGPTQQEDLLGFSGTSVGLARGQPFAANYRTRPAWPVIVAAAPDVLVSSDPRVAEWLLLPPGSACTFAVLIANAAGDALLQTTVPPAASLQHRRIYLQAFSGFGVPMHTAPPLGGVIR
jgi:hypothetical protein